MYDVSEEYLNALKKPYYEGAVSCIINGIEVNENLIIQDSLSISNQCSGSSDAPIGTVYIGEFSIMFTQEISEFLGISAGEWKGLAVEVKYSIVGTDGLWKTLPVGTFIINEVEYSENGVFVNGFDRMSAFDKELKIDASTLFLWTNKTIFEMLSMCCSACGVTLGLSQAQAQALPNGSVQFTPWAENDITTYRDLISYIAAVSGGFATINRYGLLVIRTYNQNITQQFTAKDRLKGGKVSDYTTKYTALDVDLYNKNYGEELDESPIGKVTVKDGVKMYKSASSSDEVLGTIQKGEEFTITEDDFEGGEWLKVKAQINGTAKEGYIRSTGIKKGTTPYLGTTTSSVIVREKPDSSSTQKVTLSEGQSIVVYWTESGYCRIKATINETIYNGYCDKNAIAKGKQEKSYKKHYSQDNDDGLSIDLGFNPLLMKWKESNRKTIIDRILNAISLIRYTPCELRLVGRAEVDLGDVISLSGGIVSQTQCIVCVQKIEFAGKNETKITCVGANADIASADSKALKVAKSNKGSFVAEKDIEETEIDVSDLTSRVEALESSGDGNKIYTSTADPDDTKGNDGDLWVKYFVDYNDKLINSHGDEVKINLPRYENADDAYNYVDSTIRPDIRSMCNLAAKAMNAFIKAFEGELSIGAYQRGSGTTRNITASQFSQLTVDTYTINNQSISVSRGTRTAIGWSDNPIYYRYVGTSDVIHCPATNVDDFNDNFADNGYEIGIHYYYLYYNTSNKKIEYIYGQIGLNNVNHTYWDDALWKKTSDISIDLIDTAYYTIDELYCKINDDWTLYESDDGSTVVNQVLTSGTEIAQISVDGKAVSIYAPTVSVTQVQTSGTEIGSITIDNNTTTLYAPTGGGSDVTVTPITTTGTNIANIAVNGTTYNLFAPTSGGGGGHNYSTTEQVIGTWIDGKHIYEKTYEFTTTLTINSTSYIHSGITPANIKSLIGMPDIIDVHGQSAPISAGLYSDGEIALASLNTTYSIALKYLIVRYTKTTD